MKDTTLGKTLEKRRVFEKHLKRGTRHGWVDTISDEDMTAAKAHEKEGNGCEVSDFCRVLPLHTLSVTASR